jgi:hypothetical protein
MTDREKELEAVLRELLAHDFAEDCQECAIGQSEAWAKAKALVSRGAAEEQGGKS